MAKEEWKMPPRFPGYDVSTGGRIRTYWQMRATASVVDRKARPVVMKPSTDDRGAKYVIMHQAGGLKKNAVLARVILDTFVRQGGRRDKVIYKDGDRGNVKLTNLSYQQKPAKRKPKPKKAAPVVVGRTVVKLPKRKGKPDVGARKPARRAA